MPGSTDTVLADTVVIVTGGSTGFGRELSGALAYRGYAVVVVYLDDQGRADALVDGIVAANGTAIAVRADITDELDVERLFSETIAAFGGVDVIVHAGPGGAGLVDQQAVTRLRDGGVIIAVGSSDAATPLVTNQLRARGITIIGSTLGLDSPGQQSS